MNTSKRTILIFVLIVALLASLATGVAFAYYKYVWQGGRHTISSFAVTFSLNGKSFIDVLDGNINSDQLNMSMGQEQDLGLSVNLISGTDSTVGYNIRFAFDTKTVGGEQVVDNQLARAFEVYLYTDGGYKFLCNLDKIETINLYGELVAGETYLYDLRLIYSQAAGLAYEGKTFTLIAMAETTESLEGTTTIYVGNANALLGALTNPLYEGKTIVLSNDINLAEDITATNRVRINLNGHKIIKAASAGTTPTITFAHTTAYSSTLVAGIVDDSVQSKSINLTSAKVGVNVVYATPNDFLVIGSSLLDSYANFECTNFSLEAARQIAQNNVQMISQKVFVDGNDLGVFDGFDWYIKRNKIEISTQNQIFNPDDHTSGVLKGGLLRILTQIDFTFNSQMEFLLSDLAGVQTSVRVGGSICVRGNSPQSIAEDLLATIPSKITGNVFMPTKDLVTNSAVTWIVSDGDDEYLNCQGTFVPNGFDTLSDWNTKHITIAVKVSSGDIQYTLYKTVEVEVFGAEKRTEKLYKYQQIILQPDQTITLLDFVNLELVSRTGLQNISININATDNIYADTLTYLGLSEQMTDENGTNYYSLTVLNSPSDGVAKIRAEILFEYADVGSFTVQDLEIIVLSHASTYEINDGASSLQKQFEANPYTTGQGYEFFVSANLTDGVLVEYFVPSGFKNYIMVRNDQYILATNEDLSSDYALLGFYALVDDNYLYFESMTKYNALGEPTAGGEYVKVVLSDGTETYRNLAQMMLGEEVFRRVAKVIVNAQNLSTQTVTANLYANLYEWESGQKVYKTEIVTTSGVPVESRISYNFSLVLKGIYHNNSEEIVDFNLYTALLNYFDANGDGFIGVDEATAWDTLIKESTTYYQTVYNYLNLSGLGIRNLKGIEYFNGIRGLDLSDNNIVNISQLSSLRYLTYLNLADNIVTSLQGLEYSDNLRTLILSNNNITAIEQLRYLPNLVAVDLYENNIVDFDPIGSHTNFIFLDLRYSGRTTATADERYYFALIYGNNIGNIVSGVRFSMKTEIVGSGVFTPASIEMAAATAMSQVLEIYEVYNSLYTPSYINFAGEEFYLKWNAPYTDKIVFSVSANGFYTTGCVITSGIVEEKITLTLEVTNVADTATAILLQRTFEVVLLPAQDGDATPYLQLLIADAQAAGLTATYTDATYAYVKANIAIPNMVLRNKLFDFFNTTADSDDLNPINVYDNGIVALREKYVLTYAEMTNPAVLADTYSFANAGISDLTGLRFFTGVFEGTSSLKPSLDLRGNNFDDLTELSLMHGLTTLYLGGNQFDFTQLLGTPILDQNDKITDWSGGLTTLTALYVYQCYNLSEEEVLTALYMTYIENPNVSIYVVNEETAWNPYEQLRKYSQEWKQLYNVYDIGTVNYFDGNSISVRFFDYRDVSFYVTGASFSVIAWNANQGGTSGYFANGDSAGNVKTTPYYTYFLYRYLFGHEANAYVTLTVRGDDGRSALTPAYSYVAQIVIEQHDKIFIYDLPAENTYVTNYGQNRPYYDGGSNVVGTLTNCVSLYDIYAGRSLSDAVYKAISTTEGGLCILDTAAPNAPNTFKKTTFATFEASLSSSQWNVYFDATTHSYFISKDLLASVAPAMSLEGSYFDRGTPLSGLDLTGITSLYINRDANVGDGSALLNLINLTIGYSGVDLSTITTNLPNLKQLYIGTQGATFATPRANKYVILYRTESDGTTTYAFSYMPNLDTLVLLNSRCYDWDGLNGFLVSPTGVSLSSTKLKTLRIYTTSNADSNANVTASATTAIVDNIYNLYTSTHADTPKYYVTGSSALYAPAGQTVAFVYGMAEPGEYNDFASKLRDVSVKINGNYVVATNTQSLNNNGTINLPLSTFDSNFGISYAPNAVDSAGNSLDSVRAFAISWVLVGINATTFNSCFTATNVSVSDTTYSLNEGESINAVILTYNNSAAGFSYKTEIVLNYSTQLSNDFYFVAVGHIGNGYFDKDSNYIAYSVAPNTKYSFCYPLLLKGATAAATDTLSYATISDLNLRFFVFSVYADSSSTLGCIDQDMLTEITSQTTLTIGTTPALSRDGANVNIRGCYGTYNSDDYVLRNYPTYVCSLDGIGIFSALTNISATDNMLTDISGLSTITTLKTVNLSNNLITSLTGLTTQSLTSLNLSDNPLFSLSQFNSTAFKSTLVSLNLTNCTQIGARDIKYIAEATNLSANFANLYLYGTKCAEDFYTVTQGATTTYYDAVYWLKQLNKSFTEFTMVTSTADAVSAEEFVLFFNYYDGYTSFYNDGSVTTNQISENISGYNYHKTFEERVFYWKGSLGRLTENANIVVTFSTDISEQLKANRSVALVTAGSTANYSVVSNSNSYDSTLFDSRLLAYLFDNAGTICTISGQTITVNDNLELDFDTNIGLTSLEGMQFLKVKSLRVSNNPLISTWRQSAATNFTNTIETLTLKCPYLNDEDLAFLTYCNNLTSLNLSGTRGVDFYDATTAIVSSLRTKSALTTLTINDAKGLANFVTGQTGEFAIENYLINMLYATQNAYCSNLAAATSVQALVVYSAAGTRLMTANNDDLLCHCSLTHSAHPSRLLPENTIYNPTTNNDGLAKSANLISTSTSRQSLPNEISWTVIDTSTGTTVYMPNTYTELGKKYNIVWTLWKDSNIAQLLLTYPNGIVKFSRDNYAAFSGYDSVYLLARFYLVTDGVQATSAKYSVGTTITFTNKVVRTATNTNYYVQLLGQHEEYGTPQYTDGTYYYYKASEIFASGRLIFYMFNNHAPSTQTGDALLSMRAMYNDSKNTSGDGTVLRNKWAVTLYSYVGEDGKTVLTTNSQVEGYIVTAVGSVMTQSFITGLEYFYIDNQGVTNLRGLEIFQNMKAFEMEAGASCDISCFKYLTKLEYFFFYNDGGAADRMFDIADFSPLVEGAKNTLKEFAYCYAGGVPLRDLSFLASFTNLQKVVLYSSNKSIATAGARIQYFNTASFKTFLAYLTQNRPNAKVYVGHLDIATQITADDVALSYIAENVSNTVYPTSLDGRTTYSKTLYKMVLTDADYLRGQELLYKYNVCALQSTQVNNLLVNYTNNYRLNVSPTAVQYGTTQRLYLSAYINDFGRYYALDYNSASSDFKILGYKLLLNNTTLASLLADSNLVASFVAAGVYTGTQDAAGVTAALSDMSITYEQLKILLSDTVVLEYLLNQSFDFAVLAEIDLPRVSNLHFAYMSVRIYIGNFVYERMLTFGVN